MGGRQMAIATAMIHARCRGPERRCSPERRRLAVHVKRLAVHVKG